MSARPWRLWLWVTQDVSFSNRTFRLLEERSVALRQKAQTLRRTVDGVARREKVCFLVVSSRRCEVFVPGEILVSSLRCEIPVPGKHVGLSPGQPTAGCGTFGGGR
jgi:hypothetical protein